METKCLKIEPKKMQASKTATLNDLASMKAANESAVGVKKKQWKKPVLLCGKDIGFFGQIPPDPFPDS
jgi:hypothetical protein